MKSFAILLMLAAIFIGCGKKTVAPPPLAQSGGVTVSSGMVIGNWQKPTIYEQGIGLHARAEGPSIILSFDNGTETPLAVHPTNVAVITGADRQKDLVPLSLETADLRGFFAQEIAPRSSTVFRFSLREYPNPQGYRVVFRAPERGVQFFVPVE